ncbi:MAG: hypothetical protein ACXVUE_09965, partial [Solirubrobacteraceae bacterium]
MSVCPAVVAPEITGGDPFDGCVGAAVEGTTTAVGAEIAGRRLLCVLLAVSCTRIVSPTSAAVSVCV